MNKDEWLKGICIVRFYLPIFETVTNLLTQFRFLVPVPSGARTLTFYGFTSLILHITSGPFGGWIFGFLRIYQPDLFFLLPVTPWAPSFFS